jgi:hypothetical protein
MPLIRVTYNQSRGEYKMARKTFQSNQEASNFWQKMSDKGYNVELKWKKATTFKKGYWVVTYTKK